MTIYQAFVVVLIINELAVLAGIEWHLRRA